MTTSTQPETVLPTGGCRRHMTRLTIPFAPPLSLVLVARWCCDFASKSVGYACTQYTSHYSLEKVV